MTSVCRRMSTDENETRREEEKRENIHEPNAIREEKTEWLELLLPKSDI